MKISFLQPALRSLRHCFGYLKSGFFGPSETPKSGEQNTAGAVPVWCLVANVVEERTCGPDGTETWHGTKHFAPGAKIYCFPAQWGDGYEQIRVVGRHRGSRRFVTMIVKSRWLTNWRVQLVYSPAVIERLDGAWEKAADDSSLSPETEVREYVKFLKAREAQSDQAEDGQTLPQ